MGESMVRKEGGQLVQYAAHLATTMTKRQVEGGGGGGGGDDDVRPPDMIDTQSMPATAYSLEVNIHNTQCTCIYGHRDDMTVIAYLLRSLHNHNIRRQILLRERRRRISPRHMQPSLFAFHRLILQSLRSTCRLEREGSRIPLSLFLSITASSSLLVLLLLRLWSSSPF